jgi:hypothetical protein
MTPEQPLRQRVEDALAVTTSMPFADGKPASEVAKLVNARHDLDGFLRGEIDLPAAKVKRLCAHLEGHVYRAVVDTFKQHLARRDIHIAPIQQGRAGQ